MKLAPLPTIEASRETAPVGSLDDAAIWIDSASPQKGVLIVEDGLNRPKGEAQNFKIVYWRAVEGAFSLAN